MKNVNWTRVLEVSVMIAVIIIALTLGITYIKNHSIFVTLVTIGVGVVGMYLGFVCTKWYYKYVLKK